jgi:hypothetical protein
LKLSEILAPQNKLEEIASEDLRARIDRAKGHRKHVARISRPSERSDFPELFVDVPPTWPYVDIAPLYDVHRGHSRHLDGLFCRHISWMMSNPFLLTFDGGDFSEFASKLSVASGVYEQALQPDRQFEDALLIQAKLWRKMLFKLPGNHELRAKVLGLDIARHIATWLGIPYFPDFCFCTIRFAGNNFRILAHHGTGASTTAGAQRMAARKMLPWARCFDVFWTGHLHNSLVDVVYQIDHDQKTGHAFERDALVIIAPSYLGYFGTYAAQKMYPPGMPGLLPIRLHRDGRIDASVHARGRRL